MVGEAWSERSRHLSQCLAITAATGFKTIYTHLEEVYVTCAYLFTLSVTP